MPQISKRATNGTHSSQAKRPIVITMPPVADCTLDDAETLVVRDEDLSPADFVKLFKTDPGSIKGATIVAPKVGRHGFGTIRVEYAMPRIRKIRFFKPKGKTR